MENWNFDTFIMGSIEKNDNYCQAIADILREPFIEMTLEKSSISLVCFRSLFGVPSLI